MAIEMNRSAESRGVNSLNETCVICLEDPDCSKKKFSWWLSTQVLLFLPEAIRGGEVASWNGAKMPSRGCKNELRVDNRRKFFTFKLIETIPQRKLEAPLPLPEYWMVAKFQFQWW